MTKRMKKPPGYVRGKRTSYEVTACKNYEINTAERLQQSIAGLVFGKIILCPVCKRILTDTEIQRGFGNNHRNRYISCPDMSCYNKDGLKTRFIPMLSSGLKNAQLFSRLKVNVGLRMTARDEPSEIMEKYKFFYHSIIHYYGCIKDGMKEVGIKSYDFDEKPIWYDAVKPFLGKLKDNTIASIVGTEPLKISAMRRENGIPPFSKAVPMRELFGK